MLNVIMRQIYDLILTWKEFESTLKMKNLRKESLNN